MNQRRPDSLYTKRDPKNFVEVRLRVPRDLKEMLQEQAKAADKRLSEYLRERMLNDFYDGDEP